MHLKISSAKWQPFFPWVDELTYSGLMTLYDDRDLSQHWLMPQSHPTTGPVRFLSPVRFLPVRPSEAPVGIIRRCCSCGHIRLRAPYGLTHLWFGWIICRTPWLPCAVPVRASCGHRKGIFNVFSYPTGPVRDPQGCRTAPLRTRKGIDTTIICKNPARASHLAVGAPYGPLTGCSQSQNPYGARKLIMHALKLYGPRTGRQNSYGAARGPWVDVLFLFKTAREQPVRGLGVWCDWGIR